MEILENILSQGLVQRLGWTLVHFVWQAGMVALLLAILLKLLRKSSANLRYIVACLALVIVVLLPAITMNLISVTMSYSATEFEPEPAAITSTPVTIEQLSNIEAPVIETQHPVENVTVSPRIPFRGRITEALEPFLPYVVLGWLVGVFGLSVWHLGGWTQLQRLRRRMVKPVDESLRSKLKELAGILGIHRVVQLMESALVQAPTVVGWLKPVILLPASALTGFSADQLEAILAHELAHIKRYDYLVNMLQTVVEILGFYHPVVWWVSKRIRVERENCCDDIAVRVSGDSIGYAKTLASFEEIQAGQPELAVAATGGNLFRRICRLVGKDSAEKTGFSWLPAVTAILLIIALAIPTTLALTSSRTENDSDMQIEEIWGEAVEDVQVRLQTDKTTWEAREVPKLKADVRNNGARELLIYRTQPVCELSVDGQSYLCKVNRMRSLPLGPDKQYDGLEITLDDRWYSQGAYKALRLSPGKHTIQVTSKLDDARKGAIEPPPAPVIVISNPVEIEILPNEEKTDVQGNADSPINEVIANNEKLEILGIDFEPVHQGKNEVNIKVRNKTEKEQIFRTEILTSSPDYGKNGTGWSSLGSSKIIQPQNTETVRFVYKIQGPVTDNTWVWLVLYNPLTQEDSKREPFFVKRFYSGDLEHSTTEFLDTVPANQNQTIAVQEAFSKIQDHIRNQEYKKAWELFTEDYQTAEFHGTSDECFGLFKDNMEPTERGHNAFKWNKWEFLDLQPEKVSYHDGIFYLSANYNKLHWSIQFKMEDNQYKIDWIDGYTPRFLKEQTDRQRVLSAEKLKQLGLAVAMYADDDDYNRLPGYLFELEPYFSDEQMFQWIQDNVKYFGQGMRYKSGGYQIPIAYEKTQSTDTQNTNVLYMDGHVGNVPGEEFEKLSLLLEIRSESYRKISDLGKAMVPYYSDHQRTLPDSLDGFTPYLRNSEDLDWLNKNIAYLGKGITENDRPDTIIAYDESFLSLVNYGTFVLFLDAHVEFFTTEKLKEVGISKNSVQIEMKLLEVTEQFLEDIGPSYFDPTANKPKILDDSYIAFLLRAVQAGDNRKILAAPQVVVLDNETAWLSMVEKIPLITGYTKPNSPTEEPEPIFEFKEIGTKCELRPRVMPDKQNVNLYFSIERSKITGYEERIFNGKYKEKAPLITESMTSSVVIIPGGNTLVYDGGPVSSEEENKSVSPEEQKRLIILIKPTILPSEQAVENSLSRNSFGFMMGRDLGTTPERVTDESINLEPEDETDQIGPPPDEFIIDSSQNQTSIKDQEYNTISPKILSVQPVQREIIIRGRSFDSDGKPIPNTLVRIYCQDYKEHSLELLTEAGTDSEGRFILGDSIMQRKNEKPLKYLNTFKRELLADRLDKTPTLESILEVGL